MLVPLHAKSHHSLGVGTASVAALVARAHAHGAAALALTDLESLAGQPRLHDLARRSGIAPVTGLELRTGFTRRGAPGARAGRLVLLARDETGWRSLCRIVARRAGAPGRGEGREEPWRAVAREPEGLFVLSDDPRPLERLLAEGVVARASAGLLLVRPRAGMDEIGLARAARRLGIPLVADRDAVLLDESDHALHRLLAALRAGRSVAAAGTELEARERVFPRPDDAERLFGDVPAAVAAARALAEACTLDLARLAPPRPPVPAGADAHALLRARCEQALARANAADGEVRARRLEAELAAIARADFADTLLAVGTIADLARELGIPLAARGSAAGSLVVALLGASAVDPLAHGLLFERFLHPARVERPDVDLDVAASRRDELLERVAAHFGRDRTALVSAHHAFQRRSAWRDGLAALCVPPGTIERMLARLPDEDEEGTGGPPPLPDEPTVASAVLLVERLIGVPRTVAAHPGGLVLARAPLADSLPLERAANGALVTQLDGPALQWLGASKLDLLGNHALDEIARARALMAEDVPLPAEDARTLAAVARGDTLGCAQLETPAMRRLLVRLPLASADDLVGALGVLRPGAAAGEAKERYVRRARGEEAPAPVHPRLARLLAPTHGLLVFDEDILAALASLAGLSLEEADVLRTAIQRAGEDPEETQRAHARFRAASAASGVAPEEAEHVWQAIARFARYTFCRAHAASQAQIAWETAWLAAHRPAEFAAAVLDHHGGLYPPRSVAAALQRRGTRVLPPALNRSGEQTSVVDPHPPGAVLLGLARIGRLSARTRARLLAERARAGPFRDVDDLRRRVRPAAHELDALARSGALAALEPEVPEPVPDGLSSDELRRLATSRALARVRDELEALGLHVSAHPLAILREEARRAGCVTLAEAAELPEARVAAVLAAARRLATPGGSLRFLTLEDETALLEAVLAPEMERRFGALVTTPGPYLLEGRVAGRGPEAELLVTRLFPFHERERRFA